MIEPRITSTYEHKLQAVYYDINNRGIRVDPSQLKTAKGHVVAEISRNIGIAANQWNIKLFVGSENDPNKGLKKNDIARVEAFNLNSSSGEKSFIQLLTRLGYKVPKVSKKNAEGEYESRYSANELALQRVLRDNQFNYPNGDPAIQAVLNIRELTKLDSSYLRAHLFKSPDGHLYYLSSYNVAGTLTGRRASRKHTFNFGNNAQNFPKHGSTAKIFRKGLVSRPGCIFLMVDQKSAEEWPVSALARNYEAIQEMIDGVNRHIKRAVYIFSIPFGTRTEAEWKDSMEYYLGKKTGHANNYGMQPPRMSESLIQEGKWISVDACKVMLDRLNMLEPNIRGVFHAEIQKQLYANRTLKTPFGRERQFMGLRANDSNHKVFNESYAWIPQSVVGDNTGFAVAHVESSPYLLRDRFIVQEGHDSIVQDIPDQVDSLWTALHNVIDGFDRVISFDNGINVQIPIEAEIGYNLAETIKVKDLSYDGLKQAKEALIKKFGTPYAQESTLTELDHVLL